MALGRLLKLSEETQVSSAMGRGSSLLAVLRASGDGGTQVPGEPSPSARGERSSGLLLFEPFREIVFTGARVGGKLCYATFQRK